MFITLESIWDVLSKETSSLQNVFIGVHWLITAILIVWLILVALLPMPKFRLITLILIALWGVTFALLAILKCYDETVVGLITRFIQFKGWIK